MTATSSPIGPRPGAAPASPRALAGKARTAFDTALGARVAAHRMARGLSQGQLGARLGVTFQQVQKYERGENRISAARTVELARLLEMPVGQLLGEGDAEEANTALYRALAVPGAADLLRAYARLHDADARRNLVALVRTWVRTQAAGEG